MARKPWKRMTKQEKRIAVAKDAIRQLKSNTLQAGGGGYFTEQDGTGKKHTFKADKIKKCRACGIGGLLAGMVGVGGCKLPLGGASIYRNTPFRTWIRYVEAEGVVSRLMRIFPLEQLEAIEQVFEQWPHKPPYFRDPKPTRDFWRNRRPVPDGLLDKFLCGENKHRRMLGILGNIIANQGVFIPEHGPKFYRPKKRKAKKC